MKNYSIWKDNYDNTDYDSLNQDINTDVLIIGGGITGISSLYHLRNSNLKVVLVEQNKIGLGVTANSTGKLNYLQNDLIDKVRSFYNGNVASLYLNSQIDVIDDIKKTIERENIDCDLEMVNSYVYTNNTNEINKLKNLEDFLVSNNIKVYKDNHKLVMSKYMFYVGNTYIYNPLKFINGLLKNNKYPIYENTSILKINRLDNYYLCYTKNNVIKSKYIILASHYPYFLKPLLFPIKASLEKSYLSASLFKEKPFSLISYSNPFISMRTYKNYLVYLSNSHFINYGCDKSNFSELVKKVNDLGINPEYLWSNNDIITSDGLPCIGEIKDNLFIGTGYNTWGLTNGFLAGKILSDIILGTDNKYIDLFNPKRVNIKNTFPYIGNSLKSIGGFIKGYCDSNSSKYKCPHMGCRLIHNEIEDTYDCPCHGSRFNSDGKCINSPSNKDINI